MQLVRLRITHGNREPADEAKKFPRRKGYNYDDLRRKAYKTTFLKGW
jgi:hypothetical protein